MKKIIALILSGFAIISAKAQDNERITYYDAVFLKTEYLKDSAINVNSDGLKELFAYYFGTLNTAGKMAAIRANPFLKGYFVDAGALGLGANKAPNLFRSIGNLDVTNFTDGLAKFLVARAKEELDIAFFRKFQQWLNTYPEAQILFPSTTEILKSITAYKYSAILPALAASFQKDFNALSTNLLKLRDIDNYAQYSLTGAAPKRDSAIAAFLIDSTMGRAVMAGVVAINSVIKGDDPAMIIHNVATDTSCNPAGNNDILSNSAQFVNLLSQSLKSTDSGRVWIRTDQIKALFNDEITLRLYLGLLYAKDQHNKYQIQFITRTNTVTMAGIFRLLDSNWVKPSGISFIQNLKTTMKAASDAADKTAPMLASNDKNNSSSIALYADYTNSVSNFITLATNLLHNVKLSPGAQDLLSKVAKFNELIGEAMSVCYDIKIQNYGALVVHTSNMLSYVVVDNFKFKTNYVKYGTFMAGVLSAKSSDEVAAAIDAAVLPAGSSSVKRETRMNIALNAYLGFYGGAEYLPVLKTNKWAYTMGVTAPVGIAFSWGDKKSGKATLKDGITPKGGKSLTLFVPLIDIGAMAAFRLNDDSSNVASTVQLKNIIAPGLYLYYGFGRCPLSIGIGGQYGPLLRGITATDQNISENYYFRFALNLVFDIPLINFYTRASNSD